MKAAESAPGFTDPETGKFIPYAQKSGGGAGAVLPLAAAAGLGLAFLMGE